MYDCLLFNYSVFLGNFDDISAFKLLLFAFPNITVISYILMCVHTRERDSSPGIDGV